MRYGGFTAKQQMFALATLMSLVGGTAMAQPIAVTNPSFTGNSTAGWTGFNNFGAYNGAYGGNANDNLPADGSTAYMRYYTSYLKQNLGVTIDPTKVYTATVEAATANTAWGGGGGIELYAINGATETRIGAIRVPFPNGTPKVWSDMTVQVSGAELAPYAGQTLGVRILSGLNNDRSHFDNVSVTRSNLVGTGYQAATAITVPDATFQAGSGTYDRNWTTTYWNGSPWRGGGWPMPGGSYGMPNLDGNIAVNSTYQVLPTTFVEGALYTLTAQTSARIEGSLGTDDGILALYSSDLPITAQDSGYPTSGVLDGTMFDADNPFWQTRTLTYIATAADAGKNIGIYLGSFDGQTIFDQISLTVQLPIAAAAVPEPASVAVWSLLSMVGVAFGLARMRSKKSSR